MPVLIVSENTWPQVGFSRNRSIVPVVAGDHDAEVDRVVHPLQRDRRERAAVAVRLDDGGEVDVGDDVARDHEERLVELVHRVAHRTRGAERRVLGRVPHPHAELGAVAEVVADLVGEERDRHHDVVEAVLREEPHDVPHHRHVRDREHRLGLVARERAQTGAFAAGQDDRLHVTTFVSRAWRPSASAARAAGTYLAAA